MTQVFENMPMSAYLSIDAISSSRLKLLDHSLLRYQQNPQRTSKALSMGTLVHTATLEPELMDSVHPVWDGRRDTRTAAYRDFLAGLRTDAQPCKQDERDRAEAVAAAVHHAASEWFDARRRTETVIVWQEGDLSCKARLDLWHPEHGEADLKTTRDNSPSGFPYECRRYGYFIQRAWYRRAVEAAIGASLLEGPARSTIIAAELDPVSVAVYDVDEGAIDDAQYVIDGYLEQLSAATAADEWPDVGRHTLYAPGSSPDTLDDEIDWSTT